MLSHVGGGGNLSDIKESVEGGKRGGAASLPFYKHLYGERGKSINTDKGNTAAAAGRERKKIAYPFLNCEKKEEKRKRERQVNGLEEFSDC